MLANNSPRRPMIANMSKAFNHLTIVEKSEKNQLKK